MLLDVGRQRDHQIIDRKHVISNCDLQKKQHQILAGNVIGTSEQQANRIFEVTHANF